VSSIFHAAASHQQSTTGEAAVEAFFIGGVSALLFGAGLVGLVIYRAMKPEKAYFSANQMLAGGLLAGCGLFAIAFSLS
jgi:uncharacterized membrane protein